MDRLAPTQRPSGSPAGYQSWRALSFLHWRVPPAVLRSLIPAALEIDTFAGDAFVGLVPFTMRGVRPRWAPAVPGISNFHETNVRTYVHRNGADPGVWFFSLEAANRLAVWLARALWRLPYHHARMSLAREGLDTHYASARMTGAATCNAVCRPESPPAPAVVGTRDHFLVERYLLYAARGGVLYRGQVHHAPYPLQTATALAWEESLLAAAGIARPSEPPIAHYAAGVDVEVFALERCR